jgi:nucleoid DNA-binding protein/nucleoid-associated protein YgaU
MDKKINLSQLADLMSEAGGMSKVASEQFVKNFFDIISQGVLDEGIVKVKGFGTFKLLQMEDRESVNVNTGERFTIEGHQKISFTPDAELKERINKPFSAFETVVITEEQASELTDVEISKELPTTESDDVEAVTVEETESVETESHEVESVEPKSIEKESVEKESVEAVVVNKPETKGPQVKDITQKRGTRILLKIVVYILSLILVACLALYLLWPIVGKALIKSYAEKTKPAVETVKPAARESLQVIEEAELEVEEAKPVIEEAKPVIEEAKPVVEEAKPVVEEAKPVVQEAKPVVEAPKPVVAESKPAAANDAQPFNLNQEDQAKALSKFTEADTVNYRIAGRLAVHTIEEGESLTKISNKYYGTKKLWPYLVKYNNLGSSNSLMVGSKINIPRLVTK